MLQVAEHSIVSLSINNSSTTYDVRQHLLLAFECSFYLTKCTCFFLSLNSSPPLSKVPTHFSHESTICLTLST